MENQLTPAADKTPEQIQGEMAQTRDALTEKVAALEHQVVGTVQSAADTLTGTVDAVKSFMTNAPGAVSDTVSQAASAVSDKMKEVFDVSGHVRNRPWTSVGVSAGLGFVTGLLVFRGRESLGYSSSVAPPPGPGAATPTRLTAEPAAPSGPGLFGDLFAMLGRKIREVAENAIDSASKAVNQNVRDGVPKLVERATDAAVERLSPEPGAPSPRFGGYNG